MSRLYEIVTGIHGKKTLNTLRDSIKGLSTREHFQRLGQIARNAYAENPSKIAGTVKAVRDVIGYDGVISGCRVLNGFYGFSEEEFKKTIDELGLSL